MPDPDPQPDPDLDPQPDPDLDPHPDPNLDPQPDPDLDPECFQQKNLLDAQFNLNLIVFYPPRRFYPL
jgi:hypothetical protein